MRTGEDFQKYTPSLGFTLAELLISLGILGIIATFAIPKILQSNAESRNNAIAKESAAMVSDAYQTHKLKSGLSPSTEIDTLLTYMNYVKIDTVSVVDGSVVPAFTFTCGAGGMNCIKQHNGSVITYYNNCPFSYTTATNANVLWFLVDPDGIYTTKQDSVWFALYYDGRLTTEATLLPSSTDCGGGSFGPVGSDPSWFKW